MHIFETIIQAQEDTEKLKECIEMKDAQIRKLKTKVEEQTLVTQHARQSLREERQKVKVIYYKYNLSF